MSQDNIPTPAFVSYRAHIITDVDGLPVRLSISGRLSGEVQSLTLVDDENPPTTDPYEWLDVYGWELGAQGWSQFVDHKQYGGHVSGADVVPGPEAFMPDLEDVLAGNLDKAAQDLTWAEERRTRAIEDRRDAARRARRLGLPVARIAEHLGVSRQMVARLLAD